MSRSIEAGAKEIDLKMKEVVILGRGRKFPVRGNRKCKVLRVNDHDRMEKEP